MATVRGVLVAALLAVLATACGAGSERSAHCGPDREQPTEPAPLVQQAPVEPEPVEPEPLSWSGMRPPYAVYVPRAELDADVNAVASNAIAKVNEWAGADIFTEVTSPDEALITIEIGNDDESGGLASCVYGACEIHIGREAVALKNAAIWAHELIHITDYVGNAPDGVHDTTGLMQPEADFRLPENRVVLDSVRAHLQAVAAEMEP